jgi:hypothetical protein
MAQLYNIYKHLSWVVTDLHHFTSSAVPYATISTIATSIVFITTTASSIFSSSFT